MFNVNNYTIKMYEGDFGEVLPFEITEGEILENDTLRFIIQNKAYTEIINKVMTVIENKFDFSLTQEESNLLQAGEYLWGLKQYRGYALVDTLTANNKFEVIRGQ